MSKAAEVYQTQAEASYDAKPLMNAAMCLRQAGKYLDAINILQKAIPRAPENADIYCELGWLKFHIADYKHALTDFETAINLDDKHSRAELGIASVYSNLGNKEQMIKHLDKYRTLRPDFAGVDYILADNYMKFNMCKEAEESLISALRKDWMFVEARLPLAGIYTRQGKFNEAWNQYTRILETAPSHPIASKMKKKLTGRLTKQPEEIRPPFRIYKPLKMESVDAVKKLMKSVKLRVGLGTNNMGKQGINNILRVKSFNGLTITGKASKKVFAVIPPDTIWTAIYQNNSFTMKSPSGKVLGPFTGTVILTPNTRNGTIIFDASSKIKNPWFRTGDREYRGVIELFPIRGRGIGVVNVIESELYLLGVVPSEVSPQWPYESLKAQAVIARTQILIRRTRGGGKHKADGYHICDGQHCQAYKGKSNESNTTSKAVMDTEGEILTYNGKPAETFFHASCGGWIQASKEVNGWGDVPYLTTHDDGDPDHPKEPLDPWDLHLWLTSDPPANCNDPARVSPSKFRWMKIIRQKDMNLRVNRSYKVGEISEIIPLQKAPSGNVNSIKIVGSKKTVTITREHLIRNILGFTSLKSTLFDMEINRFSNGKIRNYWIYGGGWGHGIGLCQSGSASMAGKLGKTYREILSFYFPGTRISRIRYSPRVKKQKIAKPKEQTNQSDATKETDNSVDANEELVPNTPLNLAPSVAPKDNDNSSLNQDSPDEQANNENNNAMPDTLQIISSYAPQPQDIQKTFDFLPTPDSELPPLLPVKK